MLDCPQDLSRTEDIVAAARAYSGVQTNKRVLPLLPEFKCKIHVQGTVAQSQIAHLKPRTCLSEECCIPDTRTVSTDLRCLPPSSKVLRIADARAKMGPCKCFEVGAPPFPPCCPISTPQDISQGPSSAPPSSQGLLSEVMAYQILSSGAKVDAAGVLKVLQSVPGFYVSRQGLATQWFTGAVLSGQPASATIRECSMQLRCITALACSLVRECVPGHPFAALAFLSNVVSEPHRDAFCDEDSTSVILALSSFQGGGLWVEDSRSDRRMRLGDQVLLGSVKSFADGKILFDPTVPHAPERWQGDRSVLVAYMPAAVSKMTNEDLDTSRGLGFPVDGSLPGRNEGMQVWFSAQFGVPCTPDEFVGEAAKAEHPSNLQQLVPPELRQALERNFNESEVSICQDRTATIRRWIALSNDLVKDEDALKDSLSSKRLLLYKRILGEIGHADTRLFEDICNGFGLVGSLPESGLFKRRFRPAEMLEDDLRLCIPCPCRCPCNCHSIG